MIRFIKIVTLFSLILATFTSKAENLEALRANYANTKTDKALCKRLIVELSKVKNNSATHLAYLGALQAIWANHAINPIRKLSTFKEGKRAIEQAVKAEPNNVEIRFLRLSIQKNAPFFLSYNANIKQDEKFIEKNLDKIGSAILKKNIQTMLK